VLGARHAAEFYDHSHGFAYLLLTRAVLIPGYPDLLLVTPLAQKLHDTVTTGSERSIKLNSGPERIFPHGAMFLHIC